MPAIGKPTITKTSPPKQIKTASAQGMEDNQAVDDWSFLLNQSIDPARRLYFAEPRAEKTPQEFKVNLEEDDPDDVSEKWKNCLVGFFLGKSLHSLALTGSLTRGWKTKQDVESITLENSFYLFKFNSYVDSQKVLEDRP